MVFPSQMFSVPEPGGRVPNDSIQPSGLISSTPSLVFSVIDSDIKRVASGAFANFTLREVYIISTIIRQIDTEAINNQVLKTINFFNNTFISLAKRAVVLQSSLRTIELILERNNFTSKHTINFKQMLIDNFYIQVQ